MTSHDVVSVLRRIYPGEKIGHCGTLDPNAAGVLPVGVGRGVKFSQWLLKDKKTYIAKINFGKKTETMDCYGEVISTSYINDFSDDKLNEVLNSFLGNQTQIPPKYSALKIGGKKMYQLARKGMEISDIPSRNIIIYDISLIQRTTNKIMIKITCSAGTYIRTLAEDIGKKLNNDAYLGLLIRVRSGDFKIEDSFTPEEIKDGKSSIICIEDALNRFPKYMITEGYKHYINGLKIKIRDFAGENGIYQVYDKYHNFIGLGEISAVSGDFFLKNIKQVNIH